MKYVSKNVFLVVFGALEPSKTTLNFILSHFWHFLASKTL